MSLTSLPLVEISGSPRERGRQYGEQARDRVQRALAYYAEAFAHSSGLTWEQVAGRAAGWVEPSKAFAPELVEEMEGIAEGAGVGFLDVLALNARGEIIYDTTFSTMEPEGCTSFALMGEASGDGHVYAGQNWDWRDGVSDTLMVLRVVQPGKPTVIMHVEAGQVGRQGANSAGIALNANGLGGRFDDAVGVPQTLIRRRVLDSDNLNAALEALTKSRAHIASNALITHREGFAIDLETTPGAVGWMYPTGGLLVHGNHYQAFVPPQLAATYRPGSADSLFRVPRAEGGLRAVREASGTDEARKRIKLAMSDHLGYPESLCTHPDLTQPAVKRWATLLSSCVDLTSGDYLIAAGTPCDHEYERVPWNLYDGPHGEVTP
ncbi:C45 family autoproteolytic acyltransferase/hydolase [Nonomuraea sp. NPDC049480]|uniref:C45 family autoproteolytic acyltransferase/hydolase n=1 Tax=Nonomuraea sp. NPDC049480 TaxID=3364353 RepID=UPI0037A4B7FF